MAQKRRMESGSKEQNNNKMTLREARHILQEMQKWRRSEPPYDGETPSTHRECPYTPKEFGQAIDTGIEAIEMVLSQSKIC